MTKRLCPFDEDFTPQLKVHLTKKEFELTNKEAMEDIWSKTRALLFKGARKVLKDDELHDLKQCDFCQKSLNVLLSECVNCLGSFCSNCSLMLYKNDVTESICLSCA